MRLTRRRFLQLAAGSTAGAALFVGCKFPAKELLVQSPVQMPEDLVTGLDTWYATVCRQCPAGCGTIVRVMEGRAKKVAGNPDHPVNAGKLCARGEAAVQALYHPDRLTGPLIRTGERGSGQYRSLSWDEALDEALVRLRRLQDQGEGDALVMVTEPERDHLALVIEHFVKTYGGRHVAYEPLDDAVLRAALQKTFGQDRLPDFDVENTRFLLSFGADLLSIWLSPVRYGRGYGEFRQGARDRGFLVQVDPRFSLTAANADVWLPIRPGSEGLLAMSLAQVIVAENLGDPAASAALTGGEGASYLEAFRPEAVQERAGVPAERIRWLARRFASQRPSLAIGGGPAAAHSNGLLNLQAIYALNFLVGSVGNPGGVIFNPEPALAGLPEERAAPLAEWQKLSERIRTGHPAPVKLLLVHGANPTYGLPPALGFTEALRQVPDIISFSNFMDETTALADLVLPDRSALESWGDRTPDPGPGYQALGFQQPVVRPVGDTRAFPDVLLALAEELGGDMKAALPWDTFRDVLRDGARQLYELGRGSVQAPNFEAYWNALLQRGGWWDARPGHAGPTPAPPKLPADIPSPTFAGSQAEYPFQLVPFSSNSWSEGQGAHLPWLQALPDPLSTLTWQTWVEVSLKTAGELGIEEGDIVSVESPAGALEALAYPHPGIPPGVVAIPLGQGHTDYGQYANGRGSNPFSILAPLTEPETGAWAWAATRVRLRPTGRSIVLAQFQGPAEAVQLPESELIQIEHRE